MSNWEWKKNYLYGKDWEDQKLIEEQVMIVQYNWI